MSETRETLAEVVATRAPSRRPSIRARRSADAPARARQRLLFVGTNRGPGGTESHLVSLSRAMVDAGHEVAAVVCPHDVIHDALAADGRIDLYPAHFARRRDSRPWMDLLRAARATRPDWIIGSFKHEYWPVTFVGRALGIPVALFSHLDQRTHPLMLGVLPRIVQRLILPSNYLRDRFTARGVPERRTVVLHNPVDTRYFHIDRSARAEARRALGFANDDVVVGFVGRIEPFKGAGILFDALQQAMARCGSLRALWVGQGESRASLLEAAARAGVDGRHVWLDWTPDVFPHFAAMDVLALPSVGPESFGRVLVEAQACGVPVLGSRIGGIPEALEDGASGRLLPPGDVDAWAGALLSLAADRMTRERMGRAGRAFVLRHFDSARIAEEFRRILTR